MAEYTWSIRNPIASKTWRRSQIRYRERTIFTYLIGLSVWMVAESRRANDMMQPILVDLAYFLFDCLCANLFDCLFEIITCSNCNSNVRQALRC